MIFENAKLPSFNKKFLNVDTYNSREKSLEIVNQLCFLDRSGRLVLVNLDNTK